MQFLRPRTSCTALLTLIIATALTTPRVAHPYEIGPYPKRKVHETMTLMASDCLKRAPQQTGPTICLPSPAAVMGNKVLKNTDVIFSGVRLGDVKAKELTHAVRWPDDPTREVGIRGIFKFLVKMFWHQCDRRYRGGMKDGLLCSSHHGPLQFWHAMASDSEESTKETQRKMLAWAEFLYKVVVEEVKLDTRYCDFWKNPKLEREGKFELASALAPNEQFPCPKDGPPWTIGTLFSMTCKNPFSSGVCDVSPDPRVAKLNALGALLHMVQDSYAQGHASRGLAETIAGTKRIKSKFECLPISQFYTYGKQNEDRHEEADAPPQPGYSCAARSPAIDDPILASAKVLWFVQREKGAAALTKYLEDEVFLLADRHEARAGAGECFEEGRTIPCRQ